MAPIDWSKRRQTPTGQTTVIAAALIPRLDVFISLIGALASSSLAIIFPALIQLCTFWNDPAELEAEAELEAADAELASGGRGDEERRCLCAGNAKRTLAKADCGHCWTAARGRERRRRRRQWRKRLLWRLFAAKNIFLLLFGVLGLVTGSWVSMQQLGVAST